MNFFKKFITSNEWKNFISTGNNINKIDIDYSRSVKENFDKCFIQFVKIIYSNHSDPFFNVHNDIIFYCGNIIERSRFTIFTNGCINQMNKMKNDFSIIREKYNQAIEKEKEAQKQLEKSLQQFVATSNTINQNEFRKEDIRNKAIASEEQKIRNKMNIRQEEYEKDYHQYQRKMIEVLVSNLAFCSQAEIKSIKKSITLGQNIKKLSSEIAKFPEIKRCAVDVDKLKKKIQKYKQNIKQESNSINSVKSIE